MIKRFFQNFQNPQGLPGRIVLRGMNRGHASVSEWGLTMVDPAPDTRTLDVGCGGGANIARLLTLCPQGFVDGIDISAESVKISRKTNAGSVGKRCEIRLGDVCDLPYSDETFDLVTAFETVYFWPDLKKAFSEVRRVLKPGGQFLVVCESDNANDTTWTRIIDGMTVFHGDDLVDRLEIAGFDLVNLSRHEKGWMRLLVTRGSRKILND